MATFIKPKVTKTRVKHIGEHINNPVNIELCSELVKCDKPNGYGDCSPKIVFRGLEVTWHYGDDGHTLRDEQYNEILEKYQ